MSSLIEAGPRQRAATTIQQMRGSSLGNQAPHNTQADCPLHHLWVGGGACRKGPTPLALWLQALWRLLQAALRFHRAAAAAFWEACRP